MALTKLPQNHDLQDSMKGQHDHVFSQGLNETHFDLLLKHMSAAMKAHELTEEQVDEACDTVAPLRTIFQEGATGADQDQDGMSSGVGIGIPLVVTVGRQA